MSQLNVNRVVDASGGVLAPISSVMRNRIINGGMVIAQRGTTAVTTSPSFPVDRFKLEYSGSGVLSAQQSSDAPAGFTNSTVFTVTTQDTSIAAAEFYQFTQMIEGFNTADIGFGTSDAKAVTLSFWVKASQTGTYSVQLANSEGTRCYPATYTINVANTWEYKTVSAPGITSGVFLKNNGIGIGIRWGFSYGSNFSGATANAWGTFTSFENSFAPTSNNMMATAGATLYITGVQLEVGTQATSFEYRQYGTELILCQRYFQTASQLSCIGNSTTVLACILPFQVSMRFSPTLGQQGVIQVTSGTADFVQSTVVAGITGLNSTNNSVIFLLNNFSGLVTNAPYLGPRNSANTNTVTLSAEL
jgi:hypothetical protein